MENIPIYVKEGAIIPRAVDGKTELFVAIDNSSSVNNTFTLYDDDGETEEYKTGKYGEIEMKLEGRTLKALVKGDLSFIPNNYEIVLPSGKKKSATLEELKAGIQL